MIQETPMTAESPVQVEGAPSELNLERPERPALPPFELTEEEVRRLMKAEEERRRQRNGRRSRMRELEETRTELAQKQLELMQKQQELLERDQSLVVLREEVRIHLIFSILTCFSWNWNAEFVPC